MKKWLKYIGIAFAVMIGIGIYTDIDFVVMDFLGIEYSLYMFSGDILSGEGPLYEIIGILITGILAIIDLGIYGYIFLLIGLYLLLSFLNIFIRVIKNKILGRPNSENDIAELIKLIIYIALFIFVPVILYFLSTISSDAYAMIFFIIFILLIILSFFVNIFASFIGNIPFVGIKDEATVGCVAILIIIVLAIIFIVTSLI